MSELLLGRSTVVCIAAVVAGLTAAAPAQAGPPRGPWPTVIAGAANPLLGTPFVENGGGATENASVDVWLPVGRAQRTQITRRIGGRIVIRGRVSENGTLRSVTGATVLIASEVADAPGWTVVARVQTNSRGRYRAVMPPGPTRRFAALYWPFATSAQPVFSRRVLVRATARVCLRVRVKRGRLVRFSGRVTGAPTPPSGLFVTIQLANRGRWVTIRTPRTRPSGRFSAEYRFSRRARGGRYSLRAAVPGRQPGWLLYAGESRVRKARIR